MFKIHEIVRPTIQASFLSDTANWWSRRMSGHMGPQMYSNHAAVYEGTPLSGVTTWDQHARLGTLPNSSKKATLQPLSEIQSLCDKDLPLVEFGPGSMEDARALIRTVGFSEYIPVDCSPDVIRQAREFEKTATSCLIKPAVVNFFSEDNCALVENPAFSALLGLTINNIPGPVPEELPLDKLVSTLRNLVKSLPHGGFLYLSTDTSQDMERNVRVYSEPQHMLFGVNHLHRMAHELPMNGFNPFAFEYVPVWHKKCSLLAHCVRATETQTFSVGEDVSVTVHKGDVFHYNNSFKFPPDFFESCVKLAGLSIIRKWRGPDDIYAYLLDVPVRPQ